MRYNWRRKIYNVVDVYCVLNVYMLTMLLLRLNYNIDIHVIEYDLTLNN
jgi:hypothetical protein